VTAHALDEVKVRAIGFNYVKVWFLLLIEEDIMHLNGEVILEATMLIICEFWAIKMSFSKSSISKENLV
jgi:hypothetical protein